MPMMATFLFSPLVKLGSSRVVLGAILLVPVLLPAPLPLWHMTPPTVMSSFLEAAVPALRLAETSVSVIPGSFRVVLGRTLLVQVLPSGLMRVWHMMLLTAMFFCSGAAAARKCI